MRRRDVISLLGGAAVSWPVRAHGQHRPKVARLGVLLFSTPQADPQMAAVHTRLHELGYVEGQSLVIMYRYAEGKYEHLPELAADLAREKPDLLLALGGDVAPYAAKATSDDTHRFRQQRRPSPAWAGREPCSARTCTPAGVAWIALHNPGPSLPGCRSWRHPGYGG